MMRVRFMLLWLLLVQAGSVAAQLRPLPPDEMPAARAHHDALLRGIDRLAEEHTTLSRAGTALADALRQGGTLTILGDPGLERDLRSKPGAMFRDRQDGRDAVLVPLTVHPHETDRLLALTQTRLTQGDVVVMLIHRGRLDGVRDRLKFSGDRPPILVLTGHAPQETGILPGAIEPALNAAAAWAIMAEAFAASTRQDLVPVVSISEHEDRKFAWSRKYRLTRFHDDRWLEPIPLGVLAKRYLAALRGKLVDLGTAGWPELLQAVDRGTEARLSGGRVYVRAGGTYTPYHLLQDHSTRPGQQHLARLLEGPAVIGLHAPNRGKQGGIRQHLGLDEAPPPGLPGYGDFILAIGTDEPVDDERWGNPTVLRRSGRGTAWITTEWNTRPSTLKRRDILLDTLADSHDAVVKVEHYRPRLGSVSAVMIEATVGCFLAELSARVEAKPIQPR